MASLCCNPLAMEGREPVVKYIGSEVQKRCRFQASLVTLRFCSSLFIIFFEPRASAFQGKPYQIILICPWNSQ